VFWWTYSCIRRLPPGWFSRLESDGRISYYNPGTTECTWKEPAQASKKNKLEPNPIKIPERRHVAKKPTTSHSPKRNPQAVSKPKQNVKQAFKDGYYEVCFHKKDVHYSPREDGESSFDWVVYNPVTKDCMGSYNDHKTQLPAGWNEIEDAQSGKSYYHNENTGESQWERPSGTHKPAIPDMTPSTFQELFGEPQEFDPPVKKSYRYRYYYKAIVRSVGGRCVILDKESYTSGVKDKGISIDTDDRNTIQKMIEWAGKYIGPIEKRRLASDMLASRKPSCGPDFLEKILEITEGAYRKIGK